MSLPARSVPTRDLRELRSAAALVPLQRAAGNQAVVSLLRGAGAGSVRRLSRTPGGRFRLPAPRPIAGITGTGAAETATGHDIVIADQPDKNGRYRVAIIQAGGPLQELLVDEATAEQLKQEGKFAELDPASAFKYGREAPGAVTYKQMTHGPFVDSQPRPEDVRQGLLGDCFLVGSLESIARANPTTIKARIEPHGPSMVYRIRFVGPDKSEHVIPVSAWLPFDPSGQPVFAMRGDWKEPTAEAPVAIWPGLFEKAYAEFKQRRLEEQHDLFAAEWGTIAWGDRKLVQDRDPTNQDEAFLKAMGLKVTPVRSRPNADAAFALPATAKTAIRNAFQQGSVVQASTSEHQYTIQAADDGGVVVWDPRMSRKGAGWDVPVPAQAGSGPAGELLRPTRFTWSHFSTAFVKVTVARP